MHSTKNFINYLYRFMIAINWR